MELRKLEQIIEMKKEELFTLVSNYGFQHEEVLTVSQELDKLINYMMLMKV